MKKILTKLSVASMMVGAGLAYTSDVMAQNYSDFPDVYLRGEFNGWDCSNKFDRSGNTYTIHMDELSGQFKIADQDWEQINFGTIDGTNVTGTTTLEGYYNGENWNVEGTLYDIDITFVYDDDNYAEINFVVNGDDSGHQTDTRLSGTLPVLYINVYTDESHSTLNDEIIDRNLNHKDYFSYSEYWLDVNGCEWLAELGAANVGSKEEPLPLEIKARGNWTRTGFAKKPFKLKLGKKQNLLGLTPAKSKHYAILAHADDNKGYMRNFTGFNLGKRIGLPWTPSQQPIEVVINGDYRGLYFLTESIRIDEGRVEIEELDDNETDASLISGGYLVELDNYDEENQIRIEEKPYSNGDPIVRVTFDTPEEYSAIQYQFVSDQFNKINDLIGDGSDELWSYLDMDDLARYYIVEEIISHYEAFHGSTYLFRDRGEGQKWHFSPLWDCGNGFNGPTDNFFYNVPAYGNTWIHTLVKNPKFAQKVKDTWKWFMSNKYDGIESDLRDYCDKIAEAAKADRKRWANAPRPDIDGSSDVADNTDMNSRYAEVTDHLQRKTSWLAEQFGRYDDGVYAEPERDDTPAAALPSYVVTGVNNIELTPDATDAEYFSIDGLRVANPAKGIYLKRTSAGVEKVVID